MEPTQQPMFFDVQGNLLIPGLHSPNYVTGVSGWSINQNGSAEFNNVVIRGGTVISGLALYYNGTPAAGNLIASIAAAGGTDSFGNPYLSGISSYNPAAIRWVSLQSGVTFYGWMSNTVPPVLDTTNIASVSGGLGRLLLKAGPDNTIALPDSPYFYMLAGLSSVPTTSPPNSGEPQINIDDNTGNSVITMTISGGLYKTGIGTGILPRVDVVPNTNWGLHNAAATLPTLSYWLDTNANLRLFGTLHPTAAMASGNHQVTLGTDPLPISPNNYVPNMLSTSPCGMHTDSSNVWKAQVLISVTTAGIIQLNSPVAPAINDTFHIDATFPLFP